jgi:hypothetical protein
MNGDFSQWRPFDPTENFNGVLHQQGRVLIDPDWNEQTRILEHWQGRAGRDVIGGGVLAVPADDAKGFKVESAQVTTVGGVQQVSIDVDPGHAWADGWLVFLAGEPSGSTAPVARTATYLTPPPSPIGDGVHDAVILEVSREAFNGFQNPDRLTEPALGGPDTTERILTRIAFRLVRLAAGEDCHSIGDQLKDDPSTFGKLTVSLQPTVVVPGDCPVVEGGGYTGFEHQLYRIEIAAVNAGGPMFKWSQFNGGLVGRGRFTAGPPKDKAEITANLAAILTCGLTSFYLEAVQFDSDLGVWRVTHGANATLNNQQELELDPPAFSQPLTSGSGVFSGQPVFFRLWNGLLDVNAFTGTTPPAELPNNVGIQLVFEPPAGKTYRPGDYWIFPVRAGEIGNPQTLIDQKPPQGIRYHRVPLAELDWNAVTDIEDCRRPFRPLTRQDTCCTFRVGDGVHSFGDFNATDYPTATVSGAIQAAIKALPHDGGQVCVLPGTFTENILMTDLQNVTITGCGPRSVIVSADPTGEFATASPVIEVRGGSNITIDSLQIRAHDTGIGIWLKGRNTDFPDDSPEPLIDVTLSELYVLASGQSAIRAEYVEQLTIRECYVLMKDLVCLDHAVFALGDDLLIERNIIEVISREGFAESEKLLFYPGSQSRGGLQIGGTSDRVRIINNLIRGGTGNGITLGSLIFIDEGNNPIPPSRWPRPRPVDPCDPNNPATSVIVVIDNPDGDGSARVASAGSLTEVLIERNRIYQMGMNGIGVVGFFDLSAADEFITMDGLTIIGNDIRGCLRRRLATIPDNMIDSVGYGGVSLADVERLVIRDNLIADNGPSHIEPVCGIFVLHAQGMNVSRNQILNNGAKTEEPADSAKTGRRGGINVVYAIASMIQVPFGTTTAPAQNGEPALSVEANVVSAPLGRALAVTALGPVSVVANQFTTRGVVQSGVGATFGSATVSILNLGLSDELYLQFLTFAAVAAGSIPKIALGTPTPPAGLDDEYLGAYLANGNVLFANNQCMLDLFEAAPSWSISSIAIVSLDDIGFQSNQCDCNLLFNLVLAQAFLFGFSVRAGGNRLKESLFNGALSAMTFGLMNNTSQNQTTHCLLIRAFLTVYQVDTPNTVLIDPTGKGYCESVSGMQKNFGHLNQG